MKNIVIVILTISVLLTGCSSKTDNRNSLIHNGKDPDVNVVSTTDKDTTDKDTEDKNAIVKDTTDEVKTENKEKNEVVKEEVSSDKIVKDNLEKDNLEKENLTKDKTVRSHYKSLEDIPENFTYTDAKNSEMLVISGMKIITGQDIWDEFLNKVHKGEEASVLIVKFFEITNEKQYIDKTTKQRKDDNFIKYIYQLEYDGKSYKLSHYEGNKRYAYSYPYMIEKLGMDTNAAIASHGFYLVYNEKLTYHDLRWSTLSSNSSDHINFQTVFEEKVDKDLYLSCKPGLYQTKDEHTSMYLDENCRFLFIKNKAANNLPVGRYYFEHKKLELKPWNSEPYTFLIKGKGILKYKSGNNTIRLVKEGTELIIEE